MGAIFLGKFRKVLLRFLFYIGVCGDSVSRDMAINSKNVCGEKELARKESRKQLNEGLHTVNRKFLSIGSLWLYLLPAYPSICVSVHTVLWLE